MINHTHTIINRGGTNFAMEPHITQWAAPSRRGLVASRVLTHSVVEADIYARLVGVTNRSELPLAAAIDLQALFPSVSRRLINASAAADAPTGLVHLIRSVHADTWALACPNGFLEPRFPMQSGQSCPRKFGGKPSL